MLTERKLLLSLLAAAILYCIIATYTCNSRNVTLPAKQEDTIHALQDSHTGDSLYYTNIIEEKDNEIVDYAKSNDKLKSQLSAARIGKVHTIIQTIEKTKIDTLWVQLIDSIPCIVKPVQFNENTLNYSISGQVEKKGIKFNSIIIPDSVRFIIGEKKLGFLKKPSLIVSVEHSSPYVQVKGLNAIERQITSHRFGIGIYGGYGINTDLKVSPNVGIGLSYSFVSF